MIAGDSEPPSKSTREPMPPVQSCLIASHVSGATASIRIAIG
jgi:hypothetical protein